MLEIKGKGTSSKKKEGASLSALNREKGPLPAPIKKKRATREKVPATRKETLKNDPIPRKKGKTFRGRNLSGRKEDLSGEKDNKKKKNRPAERSFTDRNLSWFCTDRKKLCSAQPEILYVPFRKTTPKEKGAGNR